jgi:hypothetical protein
MRTIHDFDVGGLIPPVDLRHMGEPNWVPRRAVRILKVLPDQRSFEIVGDWAPATP